MHSMYNLASTAQKGHSNAIAEYYNAMDRTRSRGFRPRRPCGVNKVEDGVGMSLFGLVDPKTYIGGEWDVAPGKCLYTKQ